MKRFTSLKDPTLPRLPRRQRQAVEAALACLVEAYTTPERAYCPRDDGYVLLLEQQDSPESIPPELPGGLHHALFEGVMYDRENGCFVAVVLRNNQFGLSIIVPDEPWLDEQLRHLLRMEALEE